MNNYVAFAHSAQGSNHIKVNKVCQDASACYADENMVISVVADGHGSDNYIRTDRGSSFAVNSAMEAIKEFVDIIRTDEDVYIDSDNYESILGQLAKNILLRWYRQVETDVINEPFKEEELEKVSDKYRQRYASGDYNEKAYGTTLICTCITDGYWFGMQIGDGKCVVIDKDGSISEPIPWDDDCEQNITTSICDRDAIDEFRYYFSNELPAAVFSGSDGIDDSYGEEEYHELYRSMVSVFCENGIDSLNTELQEYLPKLSRTGSGDDVSVAGFCGTELTEDQVCLIKNKGELIRAEKAFADAEDKCKVYNERIEYAKEALRKAKGEYESIKEKLERFEKEYDTALSELKAAETRLADAKQLINPAPEEDTEIAEAAEVVAEETEHDEDLTISFDTD